MFKQTEIGQITNLKLFAHATKTNKQIQNKLKSPIKPLNVKINETHKSTNAIEHTHVLTAPNKKLNDPNHAIQMKMHEKYENKRPNLSVQISYKKIKHMKQIYDQNLQKIDSKPLA